MSPTKKTSEGTPAGGNAEKTPRSPKALPEAKLPDDRTATLTKDLDRMQSDLEFLKKGNDIHNIHYASKLTRALLEQVAGLCRELKAPAPKVVLPTEESKQ